MYVYLTYIKKPYTFMFIYMRVVSAIGKVTQGNTKRFQVWEKISLISKEKWQDI